jgi:hypothetical protein
MFKTSIKISTFAILIFLLFSVSLINAQTTPQIQKGSVPQTNRITFKKEFSATSVNYIVKYLPSASFSYDKKIYSVEPTSIWWHWDDAGKTPTQEKNITQRVLSTYNALLYRTNHNEPVATHFVVGPDTILQMLPLGTNTITQGRLTNDLNIEDITKAPSLGGIQIETTGNDYDHNPPIASQTNTLISLTAVLMKQYNIPFSNILGHLERAPTIDRVDPGINYLKQTRIQLLKYLIAHKQLGNIGTPSSWNFYTQVEKGGIITNVLDQSQVEIFSQLTKNEQTIITQGK